mmetsp:Transcript_35265/g.69579  ORF Transcript_35265/g.69579 Transcript_35265/m.69579 type:complete len:155 (-) Transcript_35265:106-570(-)
MPKTSQMKGGRSASPSFSFIMFMVAKFPDPGSRWRGTQGFEVRCEIGSSSIPDGGRISSDCSVPVGCLREILIPDQDPAQLSLTFAAVWRTVEREGTAGGTWDPPGPFMLRSLKVNPTDALSICCFALLTTQSAERAGVGVGNLRWLKAIWLLL